MIFGTWKQSFEFAKLSYSTLLQNPHLLFYPLMSGTAYLVVIASYFVPLEATGSLEAWKEHIQQWQASRYEAQSAPDDIGMYITFFSFYFTTYFVIIFFNTALIASSMHIIDGHRGTLGMGLKFAFKRLPSIVGWVLLSAVFGLFLRILEKNEQIGRIVAGLLGTAWTALAYFVVPVIVSEGKGPFASIKRSTQVLTETWGTALIGNFSLGIMSSLLMIPTIIISVAVGHFLGLIPGVITAAALLLLGVLLNTAAESVFRAYLYAYATGETLPENVDTTGLDIAFVSK